MQIQLIEVTLSDGSKVYDLNIEDVELNCASEDEARELGTAIANGSLNATFDDSADPIKRTA